MLRFIGYNKDGVMENREPTEKEIMGAHPRCETCSYFRHGSSLAKLGSCTADGPGEYESVDAMYYCPHHTAKHKR